MGTWAKEFEKSFFQHNNEQNQDPPIHQMQIMTLSNKALSKLKKAQKEKGQEDEYEHEHEHEQSVEKNKEESDLSKTNDIGDLEDLDYETEKLTNSVKEEMVNVISTEGEGDKNPKERKNYIKNGLKKKTFYTSRQGRHKSNVYKSAYSVV